MVSVMGGSPALPPSHLHLFLAHFPCLPGTAGKALAHSLFLAPSPSLRKQWRMALAEQALLVCTQTARGRWPMRARHYRVPPIGGASGGGARRTPGSAADGDPEPRREVPRARSSSGARSRRAVSVPCRNGVTRKRRAGSIVWIPPVTGPGLAGGLAGQKRAQAQCLKSSSVGCFCL